MAQRWILAGCLAVLMPLIVLVNAWTLLYISDQGCGPTRADPKPGSFIAAYCDLQTTSSSVTMVFLVLIFYGPSLLALAGGVAGILKAAPRVFVTALVAATLWMVLLALPVLLFSPPRY